MILFTIEAIVTRRDVAQSLAGKLVSTEIIDGPMIDHGRVRTFRVYGEIVKSALYDLLMRELIEERPSIHRIELRSSR